MRKDVKSIYSPSLSLADHTEFLWRNRWSGPFRWPSFAQITRILTDVLLINFALMLSFLLRYLYAVTFDLTDILPGPLLTWFAYSYARSAPVATAIAIGVFASAGFYTYGRAYQTKYKALIVAQAVTIAYLLLGVIAFVVPPLAPLPRSVLLGAWAVSLLLLISSRVWSAAWRYVLRTEDGDRQYRTRLGRDRTVLVVGGAGYIGSALLPKLVANGYRVRVLDLFLYGTGPVEGFLDHPQVELVRADFRHIDAVVRAMRGVDQVVHLGGIVGDPACAIDEELTIDVNLTATRLIAEVAKGYGIKHLIFASTCSVYGASGEVLDENANLNPLSLYARSKVASEKVLLNMAGDTFTPAIVRFGTIYGLSGRTRFDLVVNLMTAKAVFEGAIPVFGGKQWRPFLHVDDAALAVSQLLRLPAGGGAEIYNIGSNKENYTIAQVGNIVKKLVPTAELKILDNCGDSRDYRVDFSKIEMNVGFKPRWTVEKGVREIIDAIKAGQVADYKEVQYSNEKFQHQGGGVALAPPSTQWAHELIRSRGRSPTVLMTAE